MSTPMAEAIIRPRVQPDPAAHRRKKQAAVKTVTASELSFRGAKRRGNLGKALPIWKGYR